MSLSTTEYRRRRSYPDNGHNMGELESVTPVASAPAPAPAKKAKLGIQFWLAFWSLAIISLTAALDSATLALALPVRRFRLIAPAPK